jgi:hypothetical protein
MPLSPAKAAKSTNTIIVPQMPPSSGRIRALRRADVCLMRSSLAGASAVSDMHGPPRRFFRKKKGRQQSELRPVGGTLAVFARELLDHFKPSAVTKPGPELMLLPGSTP